MRAATDPIIKAQPEPSSAAVLDNLHAFLVHHLEVKYARSN
jgi:hypothetical protein